MKLTYDIYANNKFQYIIDQKEFNRLMEIKKTVDRYDSTGVKKVKIDRNMDGKSIATFGKHTPERIKSEYMKGPFVVVFLSTTAEYGEDNQDHYIKQATLSVEEGDSLRVYRDSMNDGFTEAHFCDDTVMLMMLKDKDNNKHYLKVEGEPTGYASWKFEHSPEINEGANELMKSIIEKHWDDAAKEYNIDKDHVYVVIQLENV